MTFIVPANPETQKGMPIDKQNSKTMKRKSTFFPK